MEGEGFEVGSDESDGGDSVELTDSEMVATVSSAGVMLHVFLSGAELPS